LSHQAKKLTKMSLHTRANYEMSPERSEQADANWMKIGLCPS